MTEMKTLNPCHRCKSDLVTCWQMHVSWRAGCRNCGIQTSGHGTEEEAIADWNQSYTLERTTEEPVEADSLKNPTIEEALRSICQHCGVSLVSRCACKACVWRTELKMESEVEDGEPGESDGGTRPFQQAAF